MGKTFETKRHILESLAGHKRTLTDLSRELELSPSTVKQHLEELAMMGMVRFVDDIHLNRWKYYERVPSNSYGGYNEIPDRMQIPKREIVRPMEVS